jgi:hypothetical protein
LRKYSISLDETPMPFKAAVNHDDDDNTVDTDTDTDTDIDINIDSDTPVQNSSSSVNGSESNKKQCKEHDSAKTVSSVSPSVDKTPVNDRNSPVVSAALCGTTENKAETKELSPLEKEKVKVLNSDVSQSESDANERLNDIFSDGESLPKKSRISKKVIDYLSFSQFLFIIIIILLLLE